MPAVPPPLPLAARRDRERCPSHHHQILLCFARFMPTTCTSAPTTHAAHIAASSSPPNLAGRRTRRRVLHTRARVPAVGMCPAAAAVGSVVAVADRRGGRFAVASRLRHWLRTGCGARRCNRPRTGCAAHRGFLLSQCVARWPRRAPGRVVKDLSQRAPHLSVRRGLMPPRAVRKCPVRLQARPRCAGLLRFRSRCLST